MGPARCLPLIALVLTGTGCKKLFRPKYKSEDPKVTASLVKVDGKQRVYKVKVEVKTVPEATVRVTLDGSRKPSETVKASKSGEAAVELDWEAGLDTEARVRVNIDKREPDRFGFIRGDETSGSGKATVTEPFSFSSDGSATAQCNGGGVKCSMSIDPTGPGLRVNAPAGTKVDWVGKHFVTKGASDSFPLPAKDLDKLALHAFDAKPFKHKTHATFTFPSGETGKADFAFGAEGMKSTYLARLNDVKKGGVSMPNDDAMPPKARVLWMSGTKSAVFGRPTKFSDYDLVSFTESKMRERVCGPYRGEKSGKSATFELHMYDQVVTVYERRTGAVKATRTFTAPSLNCPSSFMSNSSSSSGSWPEDKAIEAWLKTFVENP